VAVLSVSDAELKRLEVLRDVDRGGLPVRAAAQLLGQSKRRVWRLLKAFRVMGVSGLISKKRGRSGAALRRGSTPARRSTQNNVPLTLLNWRKTDICILR
jgi:molybdenum-dependent DNA-binding transcriptional regulator ModE